MSERGLKRLVGALAVVAVLWVVAALLSRGGGGAAGPTGEIASFFEGVSASSVMGARMLRPEDTIVLQRSGDQWSVNGFRADSGSVARFLQALEEAEIEGLAATNPENHERLGVTEDSARTLEIEIDGSTRSILLGDEGPRFSTIYGRLPGEDAVYLVEGGLRSHVVRQLDDWRNRKMLAIDTSRVARIAVERDGESFEVVRADSAWTFADGEPADTAQVRSLLGELAGGPVASRFVQDDDSLAALPAGGSTTAYSESGEVLAEVTIGSGEGERWATVAGDSVRYRLPSFRVDMITPTLESVEP